MRPLARSVRLSLACLAASMSATLVLAGAARAQDPPRQAQLAVAPATTSLCVRDPASHEVADVRGRVARAGAADGVTTLGRTDTGLRLVGIAHGGRILDYEVVDARGGTASTLSSLAVTPRAEGDDCNPCCWKCGKDAGGTVHCWQIDCPVIVAPGGEDD